MHWNGPERYDEVDLRYADKAGQGEECHIKYGLLTDCTITVEGRTLYRIRALRDINDGVKAGEEGGYIQFHHNLVQEDESWVFGNAMVYGNALVSDRALIYDGARVYGEARVFGDVTKSGNAEIYGNAYMSGSISVHGNSHIYGSAHIRLCVCKRKREHC